MALDAILRDSLTAFAAEVRQAGWRGKEHDCVNRFAHCFLAGHVAPDSVLFHLGQIRIEGGVPQPPGFGTRQSARKDLVIWSTPEATCWDTTTASWKPVATPLAVLEWKTDLLGRNRFDYNRHDLDWLSAAARAWPRFVGYAVVLHRVGLKVARFSGDACEREWLSSSSDAVP